MKRDWFRSLFPKIEQIESIRQLRERLLRILLLTSTFVGGAVYIAALIQAIQEKIPGTIAVYTALYITLIVTTILKRLPYYLRVSILLTLIYLTGAINFYLNGFNPDSGLFFLVLVGMTFLLVGLRSGLLVLALSSLSIAAIGTFINRGVIVPVMNLPQANPMVWVVGGLVFLLSGGLLILSLHVLVNGLENQLVHMQGMLAEIQAAKTGQEEQDRRYAALLQGSTDMVGLLDHDGTILYASPSTEHILGYRPDEIIGQRGYDFLFSENQAIAIQAMTPGVPAEQIGPYLELKVRHKDGSWRVLEVAGTDMYHDPAVNGTVINCRDVTDRKQIEAELRTAKAELEELVEAKQREANVKSERLAQLVQHSPVVIYGYGYSESHQPSFISDNILQLTGYEASGFIQDKSLWVSNIHPDDKGYANQGFISDLERGYAMRQYRFLRRDGHYRWFREEARRISSESQPDLEYVGFVVDITEQKQSEEAYASLVENSMQGILLSQDSRVVFANRSLCDSLGLGMEEITGLTADQILTHLHPGDLDEFSQIRALLRGQSGAGDPRAKFEVRWIRSGGEVRWLEVNIHRMEFKSRPAYQVIVVDITARKQAELNLLESEKINRLLLETTQDSILLLNPDGIVLAGNAIGAQRLGLTIETMKGRCVYDLLDPDVAAQRREKVEQVFRTGKQLFFEDQRAGHWFLHNLYPVFEGQGVVMQVAVFATDITRRKEMEEALRLQKENLEAEVNTRTRELRVLSQELIRAQEAERQRVSRELHDEAGQLLVGLGMSLDAVLDELPKEERSVRKSIRAARGQVSRVMKGIRLLAKSLRPPALDIAGLNTVLKDICAEISDYSGLEVAYDGQEITLPEVISITLYRFAQEALTNVVKHAGASRAEVRLHTEAGQVRLTVRDNGTGMKQDRQPGSLGLLGMQERAVLLGGHVDFETSQDGTCLTFSVPLKVNGAPAFPED